MNMLRTRIRLYVKETGNILKNHKNIEEVTNCIEEFYKITQGYEPTVKVKFQDICFIREVFLAEFYPVLLKIFIENLEVEWFSNPHHKHLSEVFDKCFLDGDAASSFTVLIRCVDNLE